LPEDCASGGECFGRLPANACDWLRLARRLQRNPESLSEAVVPRPGARVGRSDRQATQPSVGQVSWVLRDMARKPGAPPRVTPEPRRRAIKLLDHPGRNIIGRLAVVVAEPERVRLTTAQGAPTWLRASEGG
jgi:hypothetical protein